MGPGHEFCTLYVLESQDPAMTSNTVSGPQDSNSGENLFKSSAQQVSSQRLMIDLKVFISLAPATIVSKPY